MSRKQKRSLYTILISAALLIAVTVITHAAALPGGANSCFSLCRT